MKITLIILAGIFQIGFLVLVVYLMDRDYMISKPGRTGKYFLKNIEAKRIRNKEILFKLTSFLKLSWMSKLFRRIYEKVSICS